MNCAIQFIYKYLGQECVRVLTNYGVSGEEYDCVNPKRTEGVFCIA